MAKGTPFTTNRDELWALIHNVPSQFNEYRLEDGTGRITGRRYHKDVGDLTDAFAKFCDEKEAGPTPMSDTCPTCGGPRQSFYVAGYERAEAKQAGRVAELEAALRQGIETMRLYMAKANNDPTPVTVEIERFGTFPGGCFNSMSGNAALRFIELAQRALKGQSLD